MYINRAGIRPQLLTPPSIERQGQDASFSKLLTQGMDNLRTLQTEADVAVFQLAAGQADDLHEVMAALERASLALELTIAIRDKLVESYQEIMRMQV